MNTEEQTGWVTYPIPPEVSLITRMHLDREKVAALILHLQNWLDYDSFAAPNAPVTIQTDTKPKRSEEL